MGTKIKKKNLLAGAIGAFGMLLGDLTLSLIEPGTADGGLFLRVAVFALVPDIRQALGCELHTFDYVMTQCSGNYAPHLYFLACLILPDSFTYAKQK